MPVCPGCSPGCYGSCRPHARPPGGGRRGSGLFAHPGRAGHRAGCGGPGRGDAVGQGQGREPSRMRGLPAGLAGLGQLRAGYWMPRLAKRKQPSSRPGRLEQTQKSQKISFLVAADMDVLQAALWCSPRLHTARKQSAWLVRKASYDHYFLS